MTSSTDDPLVTTDWLAAHLDDPKVKIIDASFKMPGVLPLPSDDYLAGAYSGRGVLRRRRDRRSPMIRGRICIRAPSSSRATSRRSAFPPAIPWWPTIPAAGSPRPRAWWMFLSFGHADVKVLDGGLKKWLREGRPTHSGKVTPKPGKFKATLDSKLRAQQAAIGRQSAKPAPSRWSMRAPRPRFEGTVAEPWPGRRSGHIPGSRNVPYAELFDATTGAMKPLDELRKAFAGAGVDLTKPIVTTCGSGVSALVLTLALYRLGVRGIRAV